MLTQMHRIFSHVLPCNMSNPDWLRAPLSGAFWCHCCKRCSLLRESRQLLVNRREKGKEMKRRRNQEDLKSLLTHAGLSGSHWNWWQWRSFPLQRNWTKAKVRILHFQEVAARTVKANCSFQSARTSSVPSNLVKALKKKQTVCVGGEVYFYYFVWQKCNLLSSLILSDQMLNQFCFSSPVTTLHSSGL